MARLRPSLGPEAILRAVSRKLSQFEARNAFDEIVKGIAKQHLRLQFRKRFGHPDLGVIDETLLVRGGVVSPLDKPLNNLFHEIPPTIKVTRIVTFGEAYTGTSFDAESGLTLGEVLSTDPVDQALIILGRKARLLCYCAAGGEEVLVAREVVELAHEPKQPKNAKGRPLPGKSAKPATNSRFRGRR